MKFKRMAVAFLLSAFFISNSFADSEVNIDDGTYGIKYISRDKKTFNYLNDKPIGEVVFIRDRKNGEILSSVHKIGCFYTHCIVYKKKVSDGDKPKENMKVFDISGSDLKDPDQKDADELGMKLADYKKMVKEDNDYGRIWQKIQLKKAEQLQKEKYEAEKRKAKRKVFNDVSGHRFKSAKELCNEFYKGMTYGHTLNGRYQHIEVKGVDAGLDEHNKEMGKCNAVFPDGIVAHSTTYSVLYVDIPEAEKKEPEKDHPKPVEKPDASNPKPSENPNVGTLGGGASPSVGNAPGGGSLGASDGGGSTGSGNGGNNGSTAQGSGKGDGEGSEKMPDVPKYEEPDWGSLKSDGNFGSYAPANVFSTGGHCMSDIRLDMGQFGNHKLQMGFLCDFLKKMRYVFIAMAYLYSAILVFKTVNSLKG